MTVAFLITTSPGVLLEGVCAVRVIDMAQIAATNKGADLCRNTEKRLAMYWSPGEDWFGTDVHDSNTRFERPTGTPDATQATNPCTRFPSRTASIINVWLLLIWQLVL